MSWEYRVVKTVVGGEVDYAIHEAYYGRGVRGEEMLWTVLPVAARGGTVDDVRTALERMLLACDLDVIDGGEA